MKVIKYLIAFTAIVTTLHTANAQNTETLLKAEKIKSADLPPEVIDAYKKKFPQANLRDIVKLPLEVYKNNWEIDELQHPRGDEQYYSLSMTGDNVDLEALYDSEGNLIRANEVAKNVKMPKKVSTYIVTNYKGYRITADKVKRLIEPNQIDAEWEVWIAKGKNSKRLFFDKNGQFIKAK